MAPRLVHGALAVFALSMVVAALLYPGGTWYDAHRDGHSFWTNFWCDLLRRTAHNGEPNPIGSLVALAGWLVLSAGMIPFWWTVRAALRDRPRLGWAVASAGSVSAIGMAAVFLTPSDRFPTLHGIAITTTAVPGLFATVTTVVLLSGARERRALRLAGLGLTIAAFVNFAQYLREYWGDAAAAAWLPGVQKVATGFAVIWMLLVMRRRAPDASS